jgi:hypothetical protein
MVRMVALLPRLGWRSHMFGQPIWNLAWGPDMSGPETKSLWNWVRSDMSGLEAGHVQEMPLEPG